MIDLDAARTLLPLPRLMEKIGMGEHAKPKAHCPFHEDKNASFGTFERGGRWWAKCQAGCGSFDEIDFLAKARSLTKGDAIKQYAELAGVSNGAEPTQTLEQLTTLATEVFAATPSVPATVPLDAEQIEKLAKWRGYSVPFVKGLSERGVISIFTTKDGERCIAFPVTSGVHYRIKDGSWRYTPGAKAELFVLGQVEEGAAIHCFESQWDALTYADSSGELDNIVATRGASNAKLIAQRLKGHTGTLYLWQQNDEPGAKWARDIRELLPDEQIKLAVTPQEHKDLNAWRQSGATDGAIWQAFLDAKDFPVPVLAENEAREDETPRSLAATATVLSTDSKSDAVIHARESTTEVNPRIPASLPVSDSRGGEIISATEMDKIEREHPPLSAVLDQIVAFLKRYMRMEEEWQADICALWAAYTWAFKSFARTPYLYIFSPEANCGKTQLMNCLYYLSPPEPRRWSIVAPSEASLFRKIHKDTPVIFVDEIDVYFAKGYDDPIVGILNAGYKIGSRVPRCIGRSGELEEFEVFCPKCFTGIGKLPSTTASRSIHIRLTRQASDDMAQSFRELEIPNEVKDITSFLADWAKTNGKTLQAARPLIPEEIKDGRKIEIIEPLLAIADLAGEEWAERARHAAVAAFDQNLETKSESIKLLASIRALFLTKSVPRMTTTEILNLLVAMEDADAPWPTWWEKDLAQNPPRTRGPAMKLAKMLQAFGIHPRTVRANYDDEPHKGYVCADFELAWKRYLPSEIKVEPMELPL